MSKFCHQCGRELKAEAKFCDSCGSSIPNLFMALVINRHQRLILIVVAVVMAVMMLYPPYYYPRDPDLQNPTSHGYDWLLGNGLGRVEVDLLFDQFLVVGLIGLIAYFLCADKRR